MENYLFKLRYLFVPALSFALAGIALYLAVFGIVVEWTGWLAADGELADYWLPFGFGTLAVMIVYAPRFRIFVPAKKGDPEFLYGLVVALMIIPPVVLLQPSLQEAMWGLTKVDTLGAVPAASKARFYALQSVCIEKSQTRYYGYAHADDRHNEVWFELYAAIPDCGFQPSHWIGVHERQSVPGNLSRDERVKRAEAFEVKVRKRIDDLAPSQWPYVERLRGRNEMRNFARAIVGKPDGAQDQVILKPQDKPFGERTQARLQWAAMAFGTATLLWLFVLLFPTLNDDEVASVRATGKLTPKPKDEFSLTRMVVPSRFLYGPAVLIDLIVGVYVAMVFSGLGVTSFVLDDLMVWGANHGPLDFGPDNYGLITALFVHGGLVHMVNNLYGLCFAVISLMTVARNSRLILCFLVCGVAGNIASLWWNPAIVSVGASGAVLGLWGIAVVLAALRDHRVEGNERFILINVAIFGGLTALFGFVMPGIDNAAHIGGFTAGLVIGLLLYGWEKIHPDPEFADEEGELMLNPPPPAGTPVR